MSPTARTFAAFANPIWSFFARLAFGYTLLAVYASLLPLNFTQPSRLGELISRFPFLTEGIGSPSDWASNVLLFIPLGFLWAAALLSHGNRARRILVSLGLVIAAAGLSLGIEFAQLWVPARTVSHLDVIAEAIGAGSGVGLWWWFGPTITIWLAARLRPTPLGRRWETALQAYAIVLGLALLFPMDPTIRPAELHEKFRTGKLLLDPFSPDAGERWAWAGLQAPFFIPVGILLATAFTTPARPVRSLLTCWHGAILIGGVLFLGQVLIRSRIADIVAVPPWLLGLMSGAALMQPSDGPLFQLPIIRRWHPQFPRDRRLTAYWVAVAGSIVWLLWVTSTATPSARTWTGWAIPDYRPSNWVILYWASCLALLGLVPRWPVTAILSYCLVSYGLIPRQHAAGDFQRAIGLIDVLTLIALAGVWLSTAVRSSRLRLHWLEVGLLAQLVWTLVSAGLALASARPWIAEATQQCFRMAEAFTMMVIAARATPSNRLSRIWCVGLGLGLVTRALVFPDYMYRDHVTAMLAAIAFPLVAYALVGSPDWTLRLGLGLVALKLGSILNAGQSRSAIGGAGAGILVWLGLPPYRWWLLVFAVIGILTAVGVVAGTPLADRFRDLWHGTEGWDTGRLDVWQIGWEAFLAHPIFGIGPGARPAGELDAHNSYLAVLSETGAVGLALYIGFWLGTLFVLGRVIWRGSRHWTGAASRAAIAAIAAYLVAGFGYSLHGLVLGYIIAGWAVGLEFVSKEEVPNAPRPPR